MKRARLEVLAPALIAAACGGKLDAESSSGTTALPPIGSVALTHPATPPPPAPTPLRPPPAPASFDVCSAGEAGRAVDPLAAIVPTVASYAELRVANTDRVVASAGTCDASCTTSLTNVTSAQGFVFGDHAEQGYYFVAVTAGHVRLARSPSELHAVVGDVTTPAEAALLASALLSPAESSFGTPNPYRIDCASSVPAVTQSPDGWDVRATASWRIECGPTTSRADVVHVEVDGTMSVASKGSASTVFGVCIGRKPTGFAITDGDAGTVVGDFFARCAELEAASVFAFARLADELRALGAPAALVEAAETSRTDEIRHAEVTRAVAERFGGAVGDVQVSRFTRRSPLAIALENATEGCVRETFGALLGHWQAKHAGDDGVRCMMQPIAIDETRHADLAWDVAAWLEPRLTVDERELVDEARARALNDLRVELVTEPTADLQRIAGLPDAATSLALLDAFAAAMA